MAVKPIPDGYHTVTPYLIINGAEKVIAFLKEAFDAQELCVMRGPNNTIMHAEVRIGDSPVMLAEATEQWKAMPTMLYLYLPDVDGFYQRALKAGATSIKEPADQFYGDRSACVRDAAGNSWGLATHVEDVSPEEMERRQAALKHNAA